MDGGWMDGEKTCWTKKTATVQPQLLPKLAPQKRPFSEVPFCAAWPSLGGLSADPGGPFSGGHNERINQSFSCRAVGLSSARCTSTQKRNPQRSQKRWSGPCNQKIIFWSRRRKGKREGEKFGQRQTKRSSQKIQRCRAARCISKWSIFSIVQFWFPKRLDENFEKRQEKVWSKGQGWSKGKIA